MVTPLVSLIIPVYNRAEVIAKTLNSIIVQSYTNWECIIVDDGSTDTTINVVQAFVKKDIRFKLFERPSHLLRGGNAARNYGFSKSSGEFINWFDSDDIMTEDHLKEKVDYLTSHKEIDFVVCKYQNFNESIFDDGWVSMFEKAGDLFENYISGALTILMITPMWKRSLLLKYDLFDEKIYQHQDLDCYSRILDKEKNIGFVDKVLIFVRENNESITIKNKKRNYHIDSYLEVKTKQLQLDSVKNSARIQEVLLYQVIKVFLYLIRTREFYKAKRVYLFIEENFSLKKFHLSVYRFKIYYYSIKFFNCGDNRLKMILNLKNPYESFK